jgi:1,4-dihydroxy-2-naphthoate octaprenyltransferase
LAVIAGDIKDPQKNNYYANRLVLLIKQLAEHELIWQVKNEKFNFKAAAAITLTVGFTFSMLFTPPLMVAVCYLACTVAIAMYMSSGAYATYREKSLRLDQSKADGESIKSVTIAEKETHRAFNDFIFSLVIENTVMPMLFISTLLVCPAVCLALAALYLGYQTYRSYDRFVERKDIEWQLAAPEEAADLLPAP